MSRLVDILVKIWMKEGFNISRLIKSQAERFLVFKKWFAKILHLTREEIPHSVAVVVDSNEEQDERDGQGSHPCNIMVDAAKVIIEWRYA